MLDLNSDYRGIVAVSARRLTANGTVNGSTIDLANAHGINFILTTGVLVDADATLTGYLFHGDAANLSDGMVVTQDDIIGLLSDFSFNDSNDNAVKQIGYKGIKRYLQMRLTLAGGAGGNADVCAVAFVQRRVTPFYFG